MQVASPAAIIEVVPLAPIIPVSREAEPGTRPRTKCWNAPSPIGRGQLIDLAV